MATEETLSKSGKSSGGTATVILKQPCVSLFVRNV